MPTTSNFGWTTPADTDLVKDGAAAIRTLGNGIDTSLVDLKGGTTGQYLIKQSNTDLDFTWTTNTADIDGITATSPLTGGGTSGTITVGIQDATTAQKGAVQLTDSISSTSTTTAATPNSVKTAYDLANGAIAKSLVDAKADLITATADNTPARLAVGNNGETLVADSSTSTGLRWQPSTGRNFALNSDFTIWQRGTSITPTSNGGAYCADRWYITRGSNTSITATQQTAGNLSVTPNQAFRYYARVQRTAATTTTSNVDFGQMFETSQVTLLAGQTVTFSAYIRKGANFSATSDALSMQIIEGTGTDQKQMDGGYTGSNTIVSTAKTLTSSWQRFSVTGTIATTSTEITIKFSYTPTGTAGAADYFEVTGVQLELGSVPTAWNLAANTLAGELAACQRYYYRTNPLTQAYAPIFIGFGPSTTDVRFNLRMPVTMRTTPTAIEYSTLRISDYNTNIAVTSLAGSLYTPDCIELQATVTGATAFRPYILQGNNSTSAYVAVTAEL